MTVGDLAHVLGVPKTLAKRIAYRELSHLRAPGHGAAHVLTYAEEGKLRALFLGMRHEEESVMTIREVANVLGVDPETIKKHVRNLYPDHMQNGLTTYLDERQVTEIKRRMIPTTAVVGAVTELEMAEKARDVLAYLDSKVNALRAELAAKDQALAIAAPKVEAHDALMHSEHCMSITDAAKHFELSPRTHVFPYLREHGYLTCRDLPTVAAIDAGYLALREDKCHDGEVRQRAMVLTSQLDTWRTRVVPQIRRWASAEVGA